MAHEDDQARDLYLYLLGPPRVLWKGTHLTIARRQVRALLYRLAVAQHPLSRDRLCFLFWPDIPQTRASRNLTHLLTHLRRALPDPSLLTLTRQGAQLDFQRVATDTAAFTRHAKAWNEMGIDESLRRAVDLYVGPFLAGFVLPTSPEFEQWLSLERQLWQQRYLEALRRLVELCTQERMLDDAIRYARMYLKTDNLAEDIHRRLIALYAATGHRVAALRQYETCTAVLDRDLGIVPLPETRALYEAVLNGQTVPLESPSPPLVPAPIARAERPPGGAPGRPGSPGARLRGRARGPWSGCPYFR